MPHVHPDLERFAANYGVGSAYLPVPSASQTYDRVRALDDPYGVMPRDASCGTEFEAIQPRNAGTWTGTCPCPTPWQASRGSRCHGSAYFGPSSTAAHALQHSSTRTRATIHE